MGAGKVSVATQVRVIKSSVAEVVEVNTREEGGTGNHVLRIGGTVSYKYCNLGEKLRSYHKSMPEQRLKSKDLLCLLPLIRSLRSVG